MDTDINNSDKYGGGDNDSNNNIFNDKKSDDSKEKEDNTVATADDADDDNKDAAADDDEKNDMNDNDSNSHLNPTNATSCMVKECTIDDNNTSPASDHNSLSSYVWRSKRVAAKKKASTFVLVWEDINIVSRVGAFWDDCNSYYSGTINKKSDNYGVLMSSFVVYCDDDTIKYEDVRKEIFL